MIDTKADRNILSAFFRIALYSNRVYTLKGSDE